MQMAVDLLQQPELLGLPRDTKGSRWFGALAHPQGHGCPNFPSHSAEPDLASSLMLPCRY